MNIKQITKKNIAAAQKFSLSVDEKIALAVARGASYEETDIINDAMREVLHSRSSAPAPEAYPLFFRGMSPEKVLTQVLGAYDSSSAVSRDVDWTWIDNVGPQGIRFSDDYILKNAVLPYYRPEISLDYQLSLTSGMLKAKRLVVQELKKRVGTLKPLTWAQAVDVVCSKDTACNPVGGSKNRPEVREWLLANPYEEGLEDTAYTLAGQRFQRNKTYKDGSPRPRGIFNPDIRFVVLAAQYEVPLMLALQEDATKDVFSPFSEVNGVKSVGRTLAAWETVDRKMSDWESIETDVHSMDIAFHIGHARHVYDILAELYTDTTGLWESIAFSFTSKIAIDESHILSGLHSLLSGVTWTHMLESILSYWVQTYADKVLCVVAPATDKRGPIAYPLSHWKRVLTQVCGDDVTKLVAKPKGFGYAFFKDYVIRPIEDLMTEIYARFELPTSPEKTHVSHRYVNYCSKTYVPGKGVLNEAGDAFEYWYAQYSPVAAYNAVAFPEYALEDPSLAAELLRVAGIVDQCYGNEHCNALYTALCNSLSKADIEGISSLLMSPAVLEDKALYYIGRSVSWTASHGDWAPSSSPFLQFLSHVLLDETGNQPEAIKVLRDINNMRLTAWKYHIDPAKALYNVAVLLRDIKAQPQNWGLLNPYINKADLRSLEVLRSFFVDVPNPENNNKLEPLTQYILNAYRGSVAGYPVEDNFVIRDPAEWRADLPWDQQVNCDSPKTTFGRAPKAQSEAIAKKFDSGVKVVGDFFED